jgi:hypothetical protein
LLVQPRLKLRVVSDPGLNSNHRRIRPQESHSLSSARTDIAQNAPQAHVSRQSS